MVANGTVTNGSVPFREVNFPSYWFNANTGEINGDIDFPINNSLRLIYGDALTLTGDFGAGTGNKLYGAYSLPFYASPAIVYSVSLNGEVIMKANGRLMTLDPEQSYTYSEKEAAREGNGTVNIVYNHTFMNHGFIDRNNIRTSMVAGP